MLFSTGIAPLITDLMIRYPHEEVIGFNLPGILLALFIGAIIGFFLPAGLAHSPKVHKGFDLYSAALPIGMTAFLLNATLEFQGKLYAVMYPYDPENQEITDEKLFFVLDEDDPLSVVNQQEILDELELLYDLGDVPGMLDE